MIPVRHPRKIERSTTPGLIEFMPELAETANVEKVFDHRKKKCPTEVGNVHLNPVEM